MATSKHSVQRRSVQPFARSASFMKQRSWHWGHVAPVPPPPVNEAPARQPTVLHLLHARMPALVSCQVFFPQLGHTAPAPGIVGLLSSQEYHVPGNTELVDLLGIAPRSESSLAHRLRAYPRQSSRLEGGQKASCSTTHLLISRDAPDGRCAGQPSVGSHSAGYCEGDLARRMLYAAFWTGGRGMRLSLATIACPLERIGRRCTQIRLLASVESSFRPECTSEGVTLDDS